MERFSYWIINRLNPANSVFDWVFATWKGNIDNTLPLGFTTGSSGTVDVTYWYYRIGGGNGDANACAFAMFLGRPNASASFSQAANPIESVTPAAAWDGTSNCCDSEKQAVVIKADN